MARTSAGQKKRENGEMIRKTALQAAMSGLGDVFQILPVFSFDLKKFLMHPAADRAESELNSILEELYNSCCLTRNYASHFEKR